MSKSTVTYEAWVSYVMTEVIPKGMAEFRKKEEGLCAPLDVPDSTLVHAAAAAFFMLTRQTVLNRKADYAADWQRIADAMRRRLRDRGGRENLFEAWTNRICEHIDTHPDLTWNRCVFDCMWQSLCPTTPNNHESPTGAMLTYMGAFQQVSAERGEFI